MSSMIAYNHEGITHILQPVLESGLSITEIMNKDIPAGATNITTIDDNSAFPADRLFREAWIISGTAIVEELTESKLISHDLRRKKRAEEFAPWDIQATIPAYAAQAETERQAIRDRYAQIQIDIDAAIDTQELRTIVTGFQGS